MGSVFQNCECETILRNIVMLQKHANPDAWTGFTWEDYKDFCSHTVTIEEKRVLDAFVNGGKPVWNTTADLSPGWLVFHAGRYHFSEKMIDMLAKEYKNPEPR